MKSQYFTYENRKQIEKMRLSGSSKKEIATVFNVHLSTVYRELSRGCCGKIDENGREIYSAKIAQCCFVNSIKNRGKNKSSKGL